MRGLYTEQCLIRTGMVGHNLTKSELMVAEAGSEIEKKMRDCFGEIRNPIFCVY